MATRVFGEIPDNPVGKTYGSRREACAAGVHRETQAGTTARLQGVEVGLASGQRPTLHFALHRSAETSSGFSVLDSGSAKRGKMPTWVKRKARSAGRPTLRRAPRMYG